MEARKKVESQGEEGSRKEGGLTVLGSTLTNSRSLVGRVKESWARKASSPLFSIVRSMEKLDTRPAVSLSGVSPTTADLESHVQQCTCNNV